MVARTGRLAALLVSVLFILPAPPSARASVRPGVRIRWVGARPQPAQAGREFVGQFYFARLEEGGARVARRIVLMK